MPFRDSRSCKRFPGRWDAQGAYAPGGENREWGKPSQGTQASRAPARPASPRSPQHAPSRGCGKASRSAHLHRFPVPPAPGPRLSAAQDSLSAPNPPAPGPRPPRSAPPRRQSRPNRPLQSSTAALPPRSLARAATAISPARGCPTSRFFPGRQETDSGPTVTGGAPQTAALASPHRLWPPPPQNHSGGRPSAYLHAPTSPVCGSGLRPHTREAAKPASPVLPQRAADSSRASRRSPRRARPLEEGQRGPSPRRALAALRWGPLHCPAWLAGAAVARPVPGTLPRTSPRAASRLAGGAAQGAERGGGACGRPGGGATPAGRGGRLSDHTPTNQESTPRKKVERCTCKERADSMTQSGLLGPGFPAGGKGGGRGELQQRREGAQ